jgi:hypothetical protein
MGYDFEHCCFHDPDIPMRYVIFLVMGYQEPVQPT